MNSGRLTSLTILALGIFCISYSPAAAADCDELRRAAQDWTGTKVEERYKYALLYQQCVVANSMEREKSGEFFVELRHKEAADEIVQYAQNEASFKGLSWGLGFGYSFGLDDDVIEEAVLVNGLVQVEEDRTDLPRAIFEFHKYFGCDNDGTDGKTGCGPFIAVAASEDEILSGVGIGFMFGKRKEGDKDGFSVGVGAILDGSVKSLADGFEPNQPLPMGESSIRFETKSRWSALVFVTRTF